MELTSDQQQRLDELLAYLDTWKAAQAEYFAWIYAEWSRRRAAFQQLRGKARARLLDGALAKLAFDKDGRAVANSFKAETAKRRYRNDADRIFSALVEAGEEIFGVKGERNRAGIYIGNLDPELRKAAHAQLKAAFKKASHA